VANFPAITHVALTVPDLDRSAVWYERLLGVEPVLDEDAGGFHHGGCGRRRCGGRRGSLIADRRVHRPEGQAIEGQENQSVHRVRTPSADVVSSPSATPSTFRGLPAGGREHVHGASLHPQPPLVVEVPDVAGAVPSGVA